MELLAHFVASIDDIHHVGCQNKWCSVTLEIAKHLSISQEFSKVNMKQMAALFHHNVVIVPVTNPQNVGHHAVSGTRAREIIDRARKFQLRGVMFDQVFGNGRILETPCHAPVTHYLNFS